MPCSHLLHIHTWTLTIVVEVLLAGNPVCRFPMFTNTRVYRTTMLVHRRNRLLERNERPTFVSFDEKMIDFPTNNIRNDVRSHVWSKIDSREGKGGGRKRKRSDQKFGRRERSRKLEETKTRDRAKPQGCSRIPGERIGPTRTRPATRMLKNSPSVKAGKVEE